MLAIRLARLGSTHQPTYRVVVNDSRMTPRAANRETIGYYDPRHHPPRLEINRERVEYWLAKGARPSLTVKGLLRRLARPSTEPAPATTPAP